VDIKVSKIRLELFLNEQTAKKPEDYLSDLPTDVGRHVRRVILSDDSASKDRVAKEGAQEIYEKLSPESNPDPSILSKYHALANALVQYVEAYNPEFFDENSGFAGEVGRILDIGPLGIAEFFYTPPTTGGDDGYYERLLSALEAGIDESDPTKKFAKVKKELIKQLSPGKYLTGYFRDSSTKSPQHLAVAVDFLKDSDVKSLSTAATDSPQKMFSVLRQIEGRNDGRIQAAIAIVNALDAAIMIATMGEAKLATKVISKIPVIKNLGPTASRLTVEIGLGLAAGIATDSLGDALIVLRESGMEDPLSHLFELFKEKQPQTRQELIDIIRDEAPSVFRPISLPDDSFIKNAITSIDTLRDLFHPAEGDLSHLAYPVWDFITGSKPFSAIPKSLGDLIRSNKPQSRSVRDRLQKQAEDVLSALGELGNYRVETLEKEKAFISSLPIYEAANFNPVEPSDKNLKLVGQVFDKTFASGYGAGDNPIIMSRAKRDWFEARAELLSLASDAREEISKLLELIPDNNRDLVAAYLAAKKDQIQRRKKYSVTAILNLMKNKYFKYSVNLRNKFGDDLSSALSGFRKVAEAWDDISPETLAKLGTVGIQESLKLTENNRIHNNRRAPKVKSINISLKHLKKSLIKEGRFDPRSWKRLLTITGEVDDALKGATQGGLRLSKTAADFSAQSAATNKVLSDIADKSIELQGQVDDAIRGARIEAKGGDAVTVMVEIPPSNTRLSFDPGAQPEKVYIVVDEGGIVAAGSKTNMESIYDDILVSTGKRRTTGSRASSVSGIGKVVRFANVNKARAAAEAFLNNTPIGKSLRSAVENRYFFRDENVTLIRTADGSGYIRYGEGGDAMYAVLRGNGEIDFIDVDAAKSLQGLTRYYEDIAGAIPTTGIGSGNRWWSSLGRWIGSYWNDMKLAAFIKPDGRLTGRDAAAITAILQPGRVVFRPIAKRLLQSLGAEGGTTVNWLRNLDALYVVGIIGSMAQTIQTGLESKDAFNDVVADLVTGDQTQEFLSLFDLEAIEQAVEEGDEEEIGEYDNALGAIIDGTTDFIEEFKELPDEIVRSLPLHGYRLIKGAPVRTMVGAKKTSSGRQVTIQVKDEEPIPETLSPERTFTFFSNLSSLGLEDLPAGILSIPDISNLETEEAKVDAIVAAFNEFNNEVVTNKDYLDSLDKSQLAQLAAVYALLRSLRESMDELPGGTTRYSDMFDHTKPGGLDGDISIGKYFRNRLPRDLRRKSTTMKKRISTMLGDAYDEEVKEFKELKSSKEAGKEKGGQMRGVGKTDLPKANEAKIKRSEALFKSIGIKNITIKGLKNEKN
jgi:hypothetical protein